MIDASLKFISAVFLVFLSSIIGTILGAIGGGFLDWLFRGNIAETLAAYGLPYVELWKVGATLGFLSAYLPKLFKSH